MATRKETLHAKATELGIEFQESTTVPQLEELIAEKEMANGGGSPKPPENDEEGVKLAKGLTYYFIKVKTYVNPLTRWDRGLYAVKGSIARLDRSAVEYVETYKGAIPQARLVEIAKTLKVSTETPSGEFRDQADILAEIVKEVELPEELDESVANPNAGKK